MLAAKTFTHQALNLLFPPQCLQCDRQVMTHGALCTECWREVAFITPPFCACCGAPFEYALEADSLCAGCINALPPYTHARAVFAYDDASRRLIMKLKYQDHTLLARHLAPWLAQAGAALLAQSTLVVPVPLHYRRYLRRRYNQSALLGAAVARHGGRAFLPDGLLRIRATPQQTGLSREERAQNVQGAFVVNPRHALAIERAQVLVVDDVLTTGATLAACARVLLEAGAAQVRVLTLARRV